ncbi:MAG: YggS family pyridoxal phosphate-dependent enzyme [Acidimicrobiales bacterium]
MIGPEQVGERLAAVQDRLHAAGGDDVRVVAVTKAFGIDAVDAAVACGIRDIGESYAQEAVAKLGGRDVAATVHFIGGLQRNKVRKLAGIVDVWQSVDRPELADEIALRAPGAPVMLQVDISGEETKGGCSPDDVAALLEHARAAGLDVVGLMGIAPLGDPGDSRPGFRQLRSLVDRFGLRECSMGMTGDLEVAVEEGSTMIRVGTALFGPRPPRH